MYGHYILLKWQKYIGEGKKHNINQPFGAALFLKSQCEHMSIPSNTNSESALYTLSVSGRAAIGSKEEG